jgi:hypothetical protein
MGEISCEAEELFPSQKGLCHAVTYALKLHSYRVQNTLGFMAMSGG